MKKINKNKIGIIATIILIILVTLVILNNIFVEQPKRLQASKDIRIGLLKDIYQECNANAYQVYNATWENNCAVKNLGENCLLPMSNVNVIENTYKENKDNCLEVYKLELSAIK